MPCVSRTTADTHLPSRPDFATTAIASPSRFLGNYEPFRWDIFRDVENGAHPFCRIVSSLNANGVLVDAKNGKQVGAELRRHGEWRLSGCISPGHHRFD